MRLASAQVAELVDALASGASALTGVEVRVFSWAPVPKWACCVKSGRDKRRIRG